MAPGLRSESTKARPLCMFETRRCRILSEAPRAHAHSSSNARRLADPEKLSLMATFPRFREMEEEHRSIILALRAGIRQRRAAGADGPEARARGPRYSLFVSFDDGLQTLTDALVRKLAPGTVRTRTGVGSSS